MKLDEDSKVNLTLAIYFICLVTMGISINSCIRGSRIEKKIDNLQKQIDIDLHLIK